MTRAAFIDFVRNFRRPYASMICATALAYAVVWGVHTGQWIPAELALVIAGVIGADGIARMMEKREGADE